MMKTTDEAPLCTICWEPMDLGERGLALKVVPMKFTESEKSGRIRSEEMEFNLDGKLSGYDHLLWHYRCIVDLLNDPSVVGKTY
jgi:hypothetical protein